MGISAWYDVWCDAEGCIEWTAGGFTRKEAVIHARQSGWRRERDGWKCPEHQRKRKTPILRETK